MAEVFDEILFWCWNVKVGGVYRIRKFKAAQNRFVAMTALVKPDVFNGKSYEEIAKKIGATKSHLSAMAKDFQKEFGLKFQRSYRDDGKFSAAAKKSWSKTDRVKTWAKPK